MNKIKYKAKTGTDGLTVLSLYGLTPKEVVLITDFYDKLKCSKEFEEELVDTRPNVNCKPKNAD